MFSPGGFFYLFSLPNLSHRRLDVDHTSTWLAENTDRKKSIKCRHLGTIAQLYQGVSSQLRDASTIRKKNLLNSNISSRRPHNMANFGPLTAEISLPVWGTPSKF